MVTRVGRTLGFGVVVGLGLTPRLSAQEPMTLPRAIALAQQQGLQAEAAKATREGARLRDQSFYSRLLPQLRLRAALPQYTRAIVPVAQPDGTTLFQPVDQTSTDLLATVTQRLPFTGGDLTVSSSLNRFAVSGDSPFRLWSSTPFSVAIQQPIFRPNLLAWDRREQPVRFEVSERQYREAKENIALQTTVLFFDAYAAKVALANATTNVAVNDTLYTLNKGRLEVGKIGENDLLQSELALLRSRTSLDGAKLEYDRALAALRLQLNVAPATPLDISVSTTVPGFDADTLQAVQQAIANGSTMSSAALQQVQAERRVTEARLNNGLGATITARYGYNATAPQVGLAYSNLLEARAFSVAVDLPLLQWGARKEEVGAAMADKKQVAAQSRLVREQVAQDAHFAALQLAQARRSLTLSAKADTVAGKRFEVAYNRYVIGKINLDNLFLAQSEKDQALSQFVLALRGYWTAYYRLRLLTLFDFSTNQPID